MSDVIEAIRRNLEDSLAVEVTRRDVIEALEVAEEQKGWRLVPVEPVRDMAMAGFGAGKRNPYDILRSSIQAAPRPWEEKE